MGKVYESVQSRGKRIMNAVVVVVVTTALFLYGWISEAVQETHTIPQVERRDIYTWVRQGRLAESQLEVVAQQTGVHKEIIAELLEERRWQLLLELQGAYFATVDTEEVASSIVTLSEYVVDEEGRYRKGTPLVDIQNGDILITKNSRFLGWRNGHAGLVVDAKKGLVLEAVMLGTNTKLCSVEKWRGYPAFQVLRMREELEVPVGAAVAYAIEHMVDVPYSLLAGMADRLCYAMTGEKIGQAMLPTLKGTQCAHLVWYVYMQVGIDLDSDGGLFVTPADLQNSPYLEVIQNYGY